MPKLPKDPMRPVDPRTEPARTEAIVRGGTTPVDNPQAGRQPLKEPYGKGHRRRSAGETRRRRTHRPLVSARRP